MTEKRTEKFADNVNDFANRVGKEVRTLRRSRSNRMIAGVCAGVGDYFGVDATIVRVLLVAATLLSGGTGVLLYLICWLVIPESD